MLESFHFDVYISGMTVALPQIFSSLISSIVIQKFKRKTINFVCFGCAFVTSFALIFIWDQNVDDSDPENLSTHILVLVLIFLLQFSITTQYTTFYIYTNEVFATQARMIAISIISLIGGLVTTGTSFIIGVCLENHFPIMIIFTFLSAVCVLLTIYLPETLGKVPRDIIDELQIGKSRSIDQSSDQLTKNLS
jgi:MFS family permease